MTAPGGSLDQTEVRFLVEKNADGIILVDGEGVVLFANPAAAEIFGRPSAALVGSSIGIPFAIDDAMTEVAIHRPDGGLVETEVRVVDTVWNRQPVRLASLRDISARKAMEERLKHAAKMEAIGRLTAGIAHDFNNLLTVVLGNLENARRQLSSSEVTSEAALAQALENAQRGAERAVGLTGRLLAFARRQPLVPRSIDVNQLVSDMAELLRHTLGEGVRVSTALDAGISAVDADPNELEAAILNLAVNARDAMPKGGELCIRTAGAALDDAAAAAALELAPGGYVVIAVEDSGVGMSEEMLKQALEPFFTTKGGHGTGLGLSQVYGFATQSRGTLALASAPGRGTAARIYLPKAKAAPTATPSSPPSSLAVSREPRARDGETILVVEDNEDVRQHAVGTLRELGYIVREAGDALQALQILELESDIALLLTDLGLPGGLDGRGLRERARRRRPELGVLIMTAYAATSLVHDGKLDAGIDLLPKPFTREVLASRVRELLDRSLREPKAPQPTQPAHILLVEDELLIRMYVTQALGALGCTIEEAGSYKEARTKLAALGDSLSAVVVDLGLPDRPGDELIAEIRKAWPTLPIILASGNIDDRRQKLEADPRLQIVWKPYQIADLQAALALLGVELAAASG